MGLRFTPKVYSPAFRTAPVAPWPAILYTAIPVTSAAGQSTPDPAPWQRGRAARSAGMLLFSLVFIVAAGLLASTGLAPGQPARAGVIAVLSVSISAAITPLLYLLAAVGWGRAGLWLIVGRARQSLPLQMALGLGLMLTLSHLLGLAGLLSAGGPLAPRVTGWGSIAVGLALLLDQVARGSLRPERWPVFPVSAVTWAPAAALLVVAACNPPGSLWASEFGAYDALSYHQQLPKEWAAGPVGRIWPVEHNVYSYLPSYVEAAFVHLGAVALSDATGVERLLGGEATWTYSCQLLHVGIALLAAIITARAAAATVLRCGANAAAARLAGIAAGAVICSTPWSIVTGSLAYNDLAVVAMLAGAALASAESDLPLIRRAATVGLLMGFACSAKPTALFLAGPAAGILLLAWSPRARWPAAIAAGAAAGILPLVPWLVRNTLAGGNPVFPFLSSLFGTAHWRPEQVDRYAAAHFFRGSLLDRVGLLFTDRGLGHQQWSILPIVALVSAILAIAWRPSRSFAWAIVAALASQVLAWLFLTHLQSRFLLPAVVPMALLFALAVAAILSWSSRNASTPVARPTLPRGAAMTVMLIPLSLAAWSVLNFLPQLHGEPNRMLVIGASGLTGLMQEPAVEELPPRDREPFMRDMLTATVYINLSIRAAERAAADSPDRAAGFDPGDLYLLGDAAVLYYLNALGGKPGAESQSLGVPATMIHYNTAWDRSLLGDAIRAHPGDPAAWSRWFLDRGITRVLVHYSELGRLIGKDHYYDDAVTPDAITRWTRGADSGLQSQHRWEIEVAGGERRIQSELFFIAPAPPGGESAR